MAGSSWGVGWACEYIAWPIFWLTVASFSMAVRMADVSVEESSRSCFRSAAAASTSVLVSGGMRSALSRMNFSVW